MAELQGLALPRQDRVKPCNQNSLFLPLEILGTRKEMPDTLFLETRSKTGNTRTRPRGVNLESVVVKKEPISGTPYRHLFVANHQTGEGFLMDTGAAISILPLRNKTSRQSTEYFLNVTNRTWINTNSSVHKELDFGVRRLFRLNIHHRRCSSCHHISRLPHQAQYTSRHD